MYIIKHEGNIRLIANCRKNNREISFDEDDYADACDCFRYCTNPYKY